MSSLKRPRQPRLPRKAQNPEVILISDTEDEPETKRVNRASSRPVTPSTPRAPPSEEHLLDDQLRAAQVVSTFMTPICLPMLKFLPLGDRSVEG